MTKPNRRTFLGALGVSAASTLAATSSPAQVSTTGSNIKLVGVGCSPRLGKSTTLAAVKTALEAAKEAYPAIEIEVIELAGFKIPGEVAAGVPLEPGARDDFPKVAEKLTDPRVRGIIVGTPTYMGSMSSLCKAFLDRTIAFRKEWLLRDKVVGAIAVGAARQGGQDTTVLAVLAALMRQDVIVVGDGKPGAHPGATLQSQNDSIDGDEGGVASAKCLGKRVAEVALRLARA